MVSLNGWVVKSSEDIHPMNIHTKRSLYECLDNRIFLRYDGESDFIILKALCKEIDSIPDALQKILYIPYFPYSYTDYTSHSFKHYVDLVNSLNFKKVHIVEASSNFSKHMLNGMHNIDISVISAVRQMMDELSLDGEEWLKPKTIHSDPNINREALYDRAKQAGIYVMFVSCFDKYKAQMDYTNVLYDVGCGEKNCKSIILIDNYFEDILKYNMIAEQLRISNPSVNGISVCAAHCTNDIYGSELINKRKINKLIATNSILHVKHAAHMSSQERETLEILDAFTEFRSISSISRMAISTW